MLSKIWVGCQKSQHKVPPKNITFHDWSAAAVGWLTRWDWAMEGSVAGSLIARHRSTAADNSAALFSVAQRQQTVRSDAAVLTRYSAVQQN